MPLPRHEPWISRSTALSLYWLSYLGPSVRKYSNKTLPSNPYMSVCHCRTIKRIIMCNTHNIRSAQKIHARVYIGLLLWLRWLLEWLCLLCFPRLLRLLLPHLTSAWANYVVLIVATLISASLAYTWHQTSQKSMLYIFCAIIILYIFSTNWLHAALRECHQKTSYNVTSNVAVGDDSLLSMSAHESWDLIVRVPPSITAKPYAMCVHSVQSMSSGTYLPIPCLQEEGECWN